MKERFVSRGDKDSLPPPDAKQKKGRLRFRGPTAVNAKKWRECKKTTVTTRDGEKQATVR